MHVSGSLIAIIGLLLPVVLVPLTMTMRLRQRKREWEHLERMKSMELGLPVLRHSPAGGVVAIGAGVPIASMLMAFLVTCFILTNADDLGLAHPHHGAPFQSLPSIPLLGIIWGSAMTVSTIAIVSALILGFFQARAHGKAQSILGAGGYGKPAFDPESYEFASHHG